MCLSTVYKNVEESSNILMSSVRQIDVEPGKVVLTDLMNRQLDIDGEIVRVDLVGGVVVVKEYAS